MSKNYGVQKKVDLTPKPLRTKEAINKDYNYCAVNVGHRMALIKQYEEEILELTEKMVQLHKEQPALEEKKEEIPVETTGG